MSPRYPLFLFWRRCLTHQNNLGWEVIVQLIAKGHPVPFLSLWHIGCLRESAEICIWAWPDPIHPWTFSASRLPLETVAEHRDLSGHRHLSAELLKHPSDLCLQALLIHRPAPQKCVFWNRFQLCCQKHGWRRLRVAALPLSWWELAQVQGDPLLLSNASTAPCAPRDTAYTFSDTHGNHLVPVYVQNNFTSHAKWHNI